MSGHNLFVEMNVHRRSLLPFLDKATEGLQSVTKDEDVEDALPRTREKVNQMIRSF